MANIESAKDQASAAAKRVKAQIEDGAEDALSLIHI